MNRLCEIYHTNATFVFVYILEAHATDEWPISGVNVDITQHKTMRDRFEAAKRFIQDFPLHHEMLLVLDNCDNDFNETYPSWPFRWWVIGNGGRIALKAMPTGTGNKIDLVELEHWLVDWLASNLKRVSIIDTVV